MRVQARRSQTQKSKYVGVKLFLTTLPLKLPTRKSLRSKSPLNDSTIISPPPKLTTTLCCEIARHFQNSVQPENNTVPLHYFPIIPITPISRFPFPNTLITPPIFPLFSFLLRFYLISLLFVLHRFLHISPCLES